MKIFGNFLSQKYEDITKFLNNNSFVKVESIVYNMCEFILFYSYEDENSKENDSENNLNDKK